MEKISKKFLSGSNSVVECNLAKVEVEGSNPFSRSSIFVKEALSASLHASHLRASFTKILIVGLGI